MGGVRLRRGERRPGATAGGDRQGRQRAPAGGGKGARTDRCRARVGLRPARRSRLLRGRRRLGTRPSSRCRRRLRRAPDRKRTSLHTDLLRQPIRRPRHRVQARRLVGLRALPPHRRSRAQRLRSALLSGIRVPRRIVRGALQPPLRGRSSLQTGPDVRRVARHGIRGSRAAGCVARSLVAGCPLGAGEGAGEDQASGFAPSVALLVSAARRRT